MKIKLTKVICFGCGADLNNSKCQCPATPLEWLLGVR